MHRTSASLTILVCLKTKVWNSMSSITVGVNGPSLTLLIVQPSAIQLKEMNLIKNWDITET